MNSMHPTLLDGRQDLAGVWTLLTSGGKFRGRMAVPGDVHSALIANGVIAHPYVGRNEETVQWVAQEDWLISREFEMPSVFPAGGWYLDIDYIDTIADVRVNGELVLSPRTASGVIVPMCRRR